MRKFYQIQLAALEVNNGYINYMMGHQVDTYNDIQMKAPEFLRGIYAASGLGIKPKTQLSKIEMLKEVARAWGLDPERILTKEAQSFPHRTYATPVERDSASFETVSEALRKAVKQELLRWFFFRSGMRSARCSSMLDQ